LPRRERCRLAQRPIPVRPAVEELPEADRAGAPAVAVAGRPAAVAAAAGPVAAEAVAKAVAAAAAAEVAEPVEGEAEAAAVAAER
jgi:hypothetical protein